MVQQQPTPNRQIPHQGNILQQQQQMNLSAGGVLQQSGAPVQGGSGVMQQNNWGSLQQSNESQLQGKSYLIMYFKINKF